MKRTHRHITPDTPAAPGDCASQRGMVIGRPVAPSTPEAALADAWILRLRAG